MVHLVFEDTTSAKSFWVNWATAFIDEFIVHDEANGNLGLASCINNLYSTLKEMILYLLFLIM